MARTQIIDEQLNALAAYLHSRRDAILHAWRAAADGDPHLTTAAEVGTIFRVILPRHYQRPQEPA